MRLSIPEIKTKKMDNKKMVLSEQEFDATNNEREVFYISIRRLKKPEYYTKGLFPEKENSLDKGIEEYGLINPVIVNMKQGRKLVVVDGWQRVQSLIRLGYEEVPVFYVYYNIDEEKEQHVLLNEKQGDMSDKEKIAMLSKLTPSDVGLSYPIIRKEFPQGVTHKVAHKYTIVLPPNVVEILERIKAETKKSTSELFQNLLIEKYETNNIAKK